MATQTGAVRQVGMWERTHVRRSRGMVSGIALVLLGIWGGVIPFVGPLFHFSYTPNIAWHYTTGRLWLEILPAAATVLGGLILLLSASRVAIQFGAWLAAAAGAWFVVGQLFSRLWNGGLPAAGLPVGSSIERIVLERVAFFAGLGVVIVFFAALALGRTSVIGVADLRDPAADDRDPGRDDVATRGYRGGYRSGEGPAERTDERTDEATTRDRGVVADEPGADSPGDEPGTLRSHPRR
jgi:hypothetical protein